MRNTKIAKERKVDRELLKYLLTCDEGNLPKRFIPAAVRLKSAGLIESDEDGKVRLSGHGRKQAK